MKTLKNLVKLTGATNVRFWGKVLGSERDYYIAEGTYDGEQDESDDKPVDFEARGTGVNKFVYWACNSPLEDWKKLPDLWTKDINAARANKVSFTGDLERSIITNPFFFGKEKHFLRAQISRISHTTTLVPKGIYKLTEDNEREIEENVPEEGPVLIPTTDQMSSLDYWYHYTSNILGVGRLTHLDPEVADD